VSERDYQDGERDGEAREPPAFDRLCLGCNWLNDYEKGYLDSGTA
jgi:hypothetical protein